MFITLGTIVTWIAGSAVGVGAKIALEKALSKNHPAKCPKCQQRAINHQLTCCKTMTCLDCANGMRARGQCEYCGASISTATAENV